MYVYVFDSHQSFYFEPTDCWISNWFQIINQPRASTGQLLLHIFYHTVGTGWDNEKSTKLLHRFLRPYLIKRCLWAGKSWIFLFQRKSEGKIERFFPRPIWCNVVLVGCVNGFYVKKDTYKYSISCLVPIEHKTLLRLGLDGAAWNVRQFLLFPTFIVPCIAIEIKIYLLVDITTTICKQSPAERFNRI